MKDKEKTTPGSMDLRAVPDWVIDEIRQWGEEKGIVGSGLAVQIRSVLTAWATEQRALAGKQ